MRSSVKQELISQIINQIKGLSVRKKKGYKVGKLKFKSEFNSIKLKQYNVTHSLRGNKFKIQGIKDLIRVRGIEQLKKYKNIHRTCDTWYNQSGRRRSSARSFVLNGSSENRAVAL